VQHGGTQKLLATYEKGSGSGLVVVVEEEQDRFLIAGFSRIRGALFNLRKEIRGGYLVSCLKQRALNVLEDVHRGRWLDVRVAKGWRKIWQ